MKRILTTTTALAVALATVNPMPLLAQEGGACVPTADNPCAPDPAADDEAAAKAAAEAEQRAADEAAAQAEAQAAAQAAEEAAAAAEAEAAAKAAEDAAEAEAAAQAEADAAAKAQAQAQAEEDARKAADAQAAAEAQAAEEAQKAQAEAEAQAAEAEGAAKAQADAADQAADDAAKAEADAQAEAQKAAEAAAKASEEAESAPVVTEEQSAAPADGDVVAAPEETTPPAATEQPVEAAPEVVETQPDTAQPEAPPAPEAGTVTAQPEPAQAEPAAPPEDSATASPETAQPEAAPVEAPAPTEAQVETLTTILGQPDGDQESAAAAAALAGAAAGGIPAPDAPPPADAVVTTQTVTESDTRSSDQEFNLTPNAAPATKSTAKKKDSGLSDLEKVGLVALGALAVGAILDNGRKEVVQNTGDRVVVRGDDGRYFVYKDDDAVLRRPGSNVRTEQYRDGSSRTFVERADGTQVVTIRDASGRVLRRSSYDAQGREIILIDDLEREQPIVISELPRVRPDRVTISASDEGATLRARMAALEAQEELGRTFSLRQIREVPQVRALAATVDVDNITFDTGSAAIRTTEAEKLASLGRFIKSLLRENPAEVFLIEGHTDAVGSAYSNLALSDRRAESVALALTEYFDVPPENLVVQGYGEAELRVQSEGDERRNRRVAVRVITPLLRTAQAN